LKDELTKLRVKADDEKFVLYANSLVQNNGDKKDTKGKQKV